MSHRTTFRALPLAALLPLAFGGCASSPERPYEALARAEAGIAQAEQSGAQQYGAAELMSANGKLAEARAAAERKEMSVAKRYAEEAALDADLAAAKTRSHKAAVAVQEIEDGIATLREEIASNQKQQEETR